MQQLILRCLVQLNIIIRKVNIIIKEVKKFWLAALEGIRFYSCICPFGWWKKFPFLPIPSFKYIRWRLDTAYGQVDHGWKRPSLKKIIGDSANFLVWRRKNRLARKARY